jgi:hypothetical protein
VYGYDVIIASCDDMHVASVIEVDELRVSFKNSLNERNSCSSQGFNKLLSQCRVVSIE